MFLILFGDLLFVDLADKVSTFLFFKNWFSKLKSYIKKTSSNFPYSTDFSIFYPVFDILQIFPFLRIFQSSDFLPVFRYFLTDISFTDFSNFHRFSDISPVFHLWPVSLTNSYFFHTFLTFEENPFLTFPFFRVLKKFENPLNYIFNKKTKIWDFL